MTSSGPSPVRGFIAAMRASLPALGSRGPRFPTSRGGGRRIHVFCDVLFSRIESPHG
ncbi:unnamed protein product [[Actinomadura] parvosata subsp. kistnae]|nr:unnamed protein product [Actinomadura parvosata subsp. kistnae]